MKRYAILMTTLLGLLVSSGLAQAGSWCYGGYQPWWNIFCRRPCLSPEEERLQRFWHDYYDALGRYYNALDHVDWVSYYKNHGYQINCACGGGQGCCPRIQFAPVFVSPQMQWAVPSSCLNGPPCGPGPGMPPPGMNGMYGMNGMNGMYGMNGHY
jgi:hypothetical protein